MDEGKGCKLCQELSQQKSKIYKGSKDKVKQMFLMIVKILIKERRVSCSGHCLHKQKCQSYGQSKTC